MDRKDRLDAFGVSAMLGFAVLFAFNQVVIKVTIEGIQPIFAAGLRSLLGLAALIVWMRWRGISMHMTRGQMWGAALVGALFSIEFLCIFLALDITTVSRASVIFYTMPIWLGLIAHFALPGERLTGVRLLGFGIAIGGVVWAFLDRSSGQASLLGDVLALIAALSWAGIALTVRLTPVSTAPAEMQLAAQLAISTVVFFALAPLFGPLLRDFSMIHGAGLLFQSIVTVLFGFLLWFAMMKIYPASDIAAFSFLSPVLSVFMGWWLLGEHIGPEIIGALVLVCIGLLLISRRKPVPA
ncbi:DMT family transporter [Planktotalea arctica]|uniref:DMT family transporter n=1 Tax=Planktotalea arctica TaxID=1481893 RepID=UPI000A1720CC|nr:DMT family transporter [Planktotalea arctica]